MAATRAQVRSEKKSPKWESRKEGPCEIVVPSGLQIGGTLGAFLGECEKVRSALPRPNVDTFFEAFSHEETVTWRVPLFRYLCTFLDCPGTSRWSHNHLPPLPWEAVAQSFLARAVGATLIRSQKKRIFNVPGAQKEPKMELGILSHPTA